MGDKLLTVSDAILRDWLPYQHQPPRRLYHYTDFGGLDGILKSQSLWATHLAYLSDATELVHGRSLVRDELERFAAELKGEPGVSFLSRCKQALAIDSSFYHYFAVCFCTEGDLLSQWKGYSDRGGGFAIGVHGTQLSVATVDDPSLMLRRVLYDESAQRGHIRTTLKLTVDCLPALLVGQTEEKVFPIVLHFLDDHLAEFYYSFKSSAFSEENEWRLIQALPLTEVESHLQFREAFGLPVPYVPLTPWAPAGVNYGKLPVESVTYGPTLRPELAAKSLTWLLRNRGYHMADVIGSRIALRI